MQPSIVIRRGSLQARLCLVAASLACVPTLVKADWVAWEAGFQSRTGRAVLSTEASPAADGIWNLYHFHRVNFEAEVRWREGDTLKVSQDQGTLDYTVGEVCQEPLTIELRLSHEIGFGALHAVHALGPEVTGCVFMGDRAGGASFQPGRLRYQMQLYRGEEELRYHDHPAGVDYDAVGASMTFSEVPLISSATEAVASATRIEREFVRGEPLADTETESFLCCTTFGTGSPSWDRIVLTFSDHTDVGIIPAGTQMRFALSGCPLRPSAFPRRCSSDPVQPLVVFDAIAPLHVDIAGIRMPAVGGMVRRFAHSRDGLLVEGAVDYPVAGETSVRVDYRLAEGRTVPSRGNVDVTLNSDGWRNLQANSVFNFQSYKILNLGALMAGAWARTPSWNSVRPPGRPAWESSVALCDKIDAADHGFAIPVLGGNFHARHLNERRVLAGSIERGGQVLPAIWTQGAASPELLAETPGLVEGASDGLDYHLAGYVFELGGYRPCLWTQRDDQWEIVSLRVPKFTVDGRALAVAENGIACGFCDVWMTADRNRVPCVWLPSASGYGPPTMLPVPPGTVSACALDLNRKGEVAGYFERLDGSRHACLWRPLAEGGYRFEDLTTPGAARAINNLGTVIGRSPEGTVFLWQCGECIDITEALKASGEAAVVGLTDLGDLVAKVGDDWFVFQPETVLPW